MTERIIELPIGAIVVTVHGTSGTITSELHDLAGGEDRVGRYNAAIDGLEAFILALACAGFDIEHENFIEAIKTTLDGFSNHFD